MDQPGSSKTDPNTIKSDKEHDLEAAKRNFETTQSTPILKVNIAVRRRRRALRHVATDLLFVVTFSESDAGELPVLNCLIGVYETILTLIRKLKNYFNDQKRRLCFFSANLKSMTSPTFSGGQDLYGEKEDQICKNVLKPLFNYLCSNAEVSLSEGLEIKVSVLSLAHTTEYDNKKRPIRKRALPDDHLIGSLKELHEVTSPHRGLIVIPLGTPNEPELFKDKCLPVAFTISLMITRAAFEGEAVVKKLIQELKSLARPHASKKLRNSVGEMVWQQTQKALDDICTTSEGPHSYS